VDATHYYAKLNKHTDSNGGETCLNDDEIKIGNAIQIHFTKNKPVPFSGAFQDQVDDEYNNQGHSLL
jgi:hypothetical protein